MLLLLRLAQSNPSGPAKACSRQAPAAASTRERQDACKPGALVSNLFKVQKQKVYDATVKNSLDQIPQMRARPMIEMRNSDLCLFLLTDAEREREREERERERPHRSRAAVPLIKAIFRPIWRRGGMLGRGGARRSQK